MRESHPQIFVILGSKIADTDQFEHHFGTFCLTQSWLKFGTSARHRHADARTASAR